MDGWMDGWINGWTDGCMDGWMHGWMDGWISSGLIVRKWDIANAVFTSLKIDLGCHFELYMYLGFL